MDKVLVSRFITAGPTTGKSTLIPTLVANGYLPFDTDYLVWSSLPVTLPAHRIEDPVERKKGQDALDRLARIVCKRLLDADSRVVIVSNLWGAMQALCHQYESADSFKLFFRKSAADIEHYINERGSATFEFEELERWISSTKHAETRGLKVHWLGKNEFLSKALGFPKLGPTASSVLNRTVVNFWQEEVRIATGERKSVMSFSKRISHLMLKIERSKH